MSRTPVLMVLAVAAVVVLAWGILSTVGRPADSPDGTPSPAATPTVAATPSPTPEPAATPAATPMPTPEPSPTDVAAASPSPAASLEYQKPEDLEVGQCFDPVVDADDDTLLAAVIVPCTGSHLAEVFGKSDLAGAPTAPFPGRRDLDREAQDLCDAAFETYVGIDFDSSEYEYVYYTPTESSWLGGDREVMCVIDDNGKPMTGSAKGTAR